METASEASIYMKSNGNLNQRIFMLLASLAANAAERTRLSTNTLIQHLFYHQTLTVNVHGQLNIMAK